MLRLDDFVTQVETVYATLPIELQERFNISIDEDNETELGYFLSINPNMIHLCLKAFQKHDLKAQDLRNVIYHELEHLLMPWWHHHSEHEK